MTTSDNKINYFSSLRYPDFLKMWLAGLFAGSSHWALIVIRGWVVYQISDSSTLVGLVTFSAMIPMILITPFIGYLADKFQRRRILQSMFLINFIHNFGLGILYFMDFILPWHLIVLAFVQGSARAARMPSGQSLVPNIVPKKNLLNAVALDMSTVHATRLLGPLTVAPLLAFVGRNGESVTGIDIAFFVCTGFYALSLFFSLMIKNTSTGKINSESFIQGFTEGIKYVHKTKPIFIVTAITTLHCMFTMSFESVLPFFSVNKLGSEGLVVSFLMMSVGIGALIASIFLAGLFDDKLKGRMFYIFAIISGIAPIFFGLSSSLIISLIAALFMGLGQAGFMIISHTLIQTLSPNHIRGRIAGVYAMYLGGSMALFNFLNGLYADFFDPGYSIAIQGLIFVLIIILTRKNEILSSIYSGKPKSK
ncbi:MAG: hypothetical protein CL746_00565 [Chloroflexi bacterium]|nr:hypothetical protein [Chloroflexota bacterium]